MSLGALLALAGTASADRLFADGDLVTPTTPQGTKPLGDVAPGAEVAADIGFVLTCVGVAHVDDGQSVVLSANGGTQPADGEIISVTTAVLDPVPSEWADDGAGCPDPVPSLPGGAFSRVTLRAPTVPGPHTFTVAWARSFQPAGNGDSLALGPSMTSINLTMNVVGNIAPRLVLPANFSVEGNTRNGWTADWSGVIATDPEDAPDPVPTCTPASGNTLPLGTNHVSCSVTDRGGLTTTSGFDVTVVDTTDPVLAGVPADSEVITSDPTGTTLAYVAPTATDVVDPSPDVTCTPATGDHVGTGTTTVTCTATDASGNSASDTFDVTVTFRAPHTAGATWQDPIDVSGNTFSTNHGRTLPVKVRLFVDGSELKGGSASLVVTPCGGGTALDLPLTTGGGRWNASLDTSLLVGSCHTVTAWVQGLEAGSFRLELRGAEPTRANKSPTATPTSTATETPTSTATPAPTSDSKPAKAAEPKSGGPDTAKPDKSKDPKPDKAGKK